MATKSTKKTAATKATKKTSPKKGPDKAPAKATKPTRKPKEGGVIATIVEFLGVATKEKPLSKPALLAKLKTRFPDRGEVAMMRTINCQVPARLRKEKGLDVQRTDDGYYIKPSK
jgi:hypothetical protein